MSRSASAARSAWYQIDSGLGRGAGRSRAAGVDCDLDAVPVRLLDDRRHLILGDCLSVAPGVIRELDQIGMTTAAADRPTVSRAQYRKAITAGVIGKLLEWYDFGVYGYLDRQSRSSSSQAATLSFLCCRPLRWLVSAL